MADLRIKPNDVEVDGPEVMKCLKTIDHEDEMTYWIEGEEDAAILGA